jgi:hypothetical protein
MPKTLKIAASSSVNPGTIQAVGPVSPLNGELYPCPPATDAATRPVSQANSKW